MHIPVSAVICIAVYRMYHGVLVSLLLRLGFVSDLSFAARPQLRRRSQKKPGARILFAVKLSDLPPHVRSYFSSAFCKILCYHSLHYSATVVPSAPASGHRFILLISFSLFHTPTCFLFYFLGLSSFAFYTAYDVRSRRKIRRFYWRKNAVAVSLAFCPAIIPVLRLYRPHYARFTHLSLLICFIC